MKLSQEIEQILWRIDPLKLNETGCPSDEYQPEARMLYAIMQNKDITIEDIIDVFNKMFWEDVVSQERAKEILEAIT